MSENTQEPIPRILVIEDDPDQRALLCEALQIHYGDATGRFIRGAGSGQEALALDLTQFDAILQDYNLPDYSGMDLLTELLKHCDLPVIVVTGENITQTAAQAVRAGAADYVVKLGDYLFALPVVVDKNIRQHGLRRENQRLQNELQNMLRELQTTNAQLEQSLEQQRKMATTDHLTGLANRRHFADCLERYYLEATRYGFDLTCCMCDLDHYKQLNDTMGHQIGDQVLIIAAEVIRSSLRGSDLAARYGGDEFVLLLPHTPMEMGVSAGQRIRQQLVGAIQEHNLFQLPVTMSIGVASLELNQASSGDHLLSLADKALYMAKEQGKDRIVAFGQRAMTA